MKRVLVALVLMLPVTALAQSPQVEMKMVASDPLVFGMTQTEQESPATEDYMAYPTEITLQHVIPGSVEHQFVLQGAIGEDGPWNILDGIERASTWKQPVMQRDLPDTVHVILEKDYLQTRPDEEVTLDVPAPVLADAVRKAWGARNPNVACKSVNDAPCYTYRSQERLRFMGTDGKRYTLTIHRAGGC